MKIPDSNLLDSLIAQAKGNPRLRQNFNLHASYKDPCLRLLNAMEPRSYIRPHRHLKDPKPECFLWIRGKLALIIFSGEGEVENVIPFGPNSRTAGADLPPGI